MLKAAGAAALFALFAGPALAQPKTLTVAGINLSAGQQARLTNTLELGQVTDSVKVEATGSLVNTVSAEQLNSFQPHEMKELPLQNRNFTRILILTTGAVPSTGSSTGVNMNGIGTNGTQWSLDGTNASGNTTRSARSSAGRAPTTSEW
jgi:hypothetical protein